MFDSRINHIICAIDDVEGFMSLIKKPITGDNMAAVMLGILGEKDFWLNDSYAENIKRGREALGLSQEELAQAAGITGGGGSISRYENGTHKPNADTLDAIRKVLTFRYV